MTSAKRWQIYERRSAWILTTAAVLFLPLLRPLRAVRVVTALARLNRTSVSVRGRTTTYVIGAVLLLGFVSALAVLDAERTSPAANIRSFADATWWAATTITTVGYGDQYPTTSQGRVATTDTSYDD